MLMQNRTAGIPGLPLPSIPARPSGITICVKRLATPVASLTRGKRATRGRRGLRLRKMSVEDSHPLFAQLVRGSACCVGSPSTGPSSTACAPECRSLGADNNLNFLHYPPEAERGGRGRPCGLSATARPVAARRAWANESGAAASGATVPQAVTAHDRFAPTPAVSWTTTFTRSRVLASARVLANGGTDWSGRGQSAASPGAGAAAAASAGVALRFQRDSPVEDGEHASKVRSPLGREA
jgi:hypothetical protein